MNYWLWWPPYVKEVKENLTIPMVVSGEVHLLPWITQTIIVLTEIMLTILPHNSLFHCVRYGQAFFKITVSLLPLLHATESLIKHSRIRKSTSLLLCGLLTSLLTFIKVLVLMRYYFFCCVGCEALEYLHSCQGNTPAPLAQFQQCWGNS